MASDRGDERRQEGEKINRVVTELDPVHKPVFVALQWAESTESQKRSSMFKASERRDATVRMW